MKAFNMRRVAWMLALALLLALTVVLCVLPAGAEGEDCVHAEGYNNGYCIGCRALQPATEDGEGWYEISNAGQLYWVAQKMSENAAAEPIRAKLVCNVTVNADLLDANGQPRAAATLWVPIGIDSTMAGAVLDGRGYYISGLYANYDDGRDVGLFGNANGVTVRDLGIVDSYFGSDVGFVGGIFGHAESACVLQRCYVQGVVTGGIQCGGLAGVLEVDGGCTASYCYTMAPAAFGVIANNTVDHCYYRANSETDAFDGTAFFTEDWKLADAVTTLDAALFTTDKTWVLNCRTGLLCLNAEHVYAYVCTPECTVCGDTNRVGQAAHTYSYECDNSCNVCSRVDPNKTGHTPYQKCGTVCQYCGTEIEKDKVGAHEYATECAKSCKWCGNERTAVPHKYDGNCDATCNICSYVRDAVPHVYDNDCDRQCNACNVTRKPQHTYDSVCDTDCNVCGETREAGHVYGDYTVTKEATALRNGAKERTCTLCGHKDTAEIARLGVATWVVVLCGVGVGLVLSLGGFVLYWCVIKKRTLAQFFGKESAKKSDKKPNKKKDEEKADEE